MNTVHVHSLEHFVRVVNLKGLKHSQVTLGLHAGVSNHKGMHVDVFPAVIKQIGLQVIVLRQLLCHSVMDSIVPCVPYLHQVDGMLLSVGFRVALLSSTCDCRTPGNTTRSGLLVCLL